MSWLVKSLVQQTVCSVSGPSGPHAPIHAPVKLQREAKAGVGPSWPFRQKVSGKYFKLVAVCLFNELTCVPLPSCV